MGILRKMKQRAAEMEKSYFPYTWKDKPSIESPINSVNLNHIESGINELDNRIVVLSKDKAEKTELANVFINFEFDENSGVMTFTRFDGSKVEKDTAMEKIALNCYLEGDNFVLELADGSKQTVSLSKFIDTYTFKSTDVIRMSVNGKEVSADIPDGKITLEKLEATVMSTIRQCVLDAQTAKGVAEQAASTAQGWAIGGESFEKNNAKYFSGQSKRYAVGGVEEGDETDNAQYYCEEARKAAEQAAGSVGFDGTAASVSAVDTHNLTGAGPGKKSTVQNLLDVIAQKLVEKVVTSDTFQTVLAKYLVNNGLTTETGKFALDAAYGKNLQDQITQQNSNIGGIKTNVATLSNELTKKSNKLQYGTRYDVAEEQTISSDTIIGSCEPSIPFDCYVIAHHHITLKSSARNARVYWMLGGAYIQGTESWDGTTSQEYAFDKTFIYEATAGQIIQLRMTDVNKVGIVSTGNNTSLNRHSFIYIPK